MNEKTALTHRELVGGVLRLVSERCRGWMKGSGGIRNRAMTANEWGRLGQPLSGGNQVAFNLNYYELDNK